MSPGLSSSEKRRMSQYENRCIRLCPQHDVLQHQSMLLLSVFLTPGSLVMRRGCDCHQNRSTVDFVTSNFLLYFNNKYSDWSHSNNMHQSLMAHNKPDAGLDTLTCSNFNPHNTTLQDKKVFFHSTDDETEELWANEIIWHLTTLITLHFFKHFLYKVAIKLDSYWYIYSNNMIILHI